jgi:hypothetical protein
MAEANCKACPPSDARFFLLKRKVERKRIRKFSFYTTDLVKRQAIYRDQPLLQDD